MTKDLSHIPDVEYNTDRPDLAIPEYGRNVHRMVEHCMTIEDREKRNAVAQSIIDVIGNLNPHLRDTPDFKHKLWDHLFIMSDFKLDVDSPYPIPTAETFAGRPEQLEYPARTYKMRHYGHIVRQLIDEAVNKEGEEQKELIRQIANQMKRSYLTFNKDTVDDAIILQELKILSQGKLDTEGIELSNELVLPTSTTNMSSGSKNRRKKKGRSNKRKK